MKMVLSHFYAKACAVARLPNYRYFFKTLVLVALLLTLFIIYFHIAFMWPVSKFALESHQNPQSGHSYEQFFKKSKGAHRFSPNEIISCCKWMSKQPADKYEDILRKGMAKSLLVAGIVPVSTALCILLSVAFFCFLFDNLFAEIRQRRKWLNVLLAVYPCLVIILLAFIILPVANYVVALPK